MLRSARLDAPGVLPYIIIRGIEGWANSSGMPGSGIGRRGIYEFQSNVRAGGREIPAGSE